MAKQTVSVVERHVEKGVLGIALACLIYVVVTHLLTTPNRIEVGGNLESPATIDRALAEQADRVRDAIRSSEYDAPPVEPRYPRFVQANDPLAVANVSPTWPRAVPFGLPVPDVGLGPKVEGSIQLAPVVQLPKPTLVSGRSTVEFITNPTVFRIGYRDDAQGLDLPTEEFAVNWVRVESTFDRERQKMLDEKAYGGGVEDPLVVRVHTQRRARRPDGSWSDDDWQDIRPYTIAVLPEVGPIRLQRGSENELQVNVEDLDEIDQFRRLIKDPHVRVNILRPLFPDVVEGSPWPHPGTEVMAQDTTILFGQNQRPGDYHDRYTVVVATSGPKKDEEGPPEGTNAREYIAEAMTEFDRAFAVQDENGQVLAYNKVFYYVKNEVKFDPFIVTLAKEKSAEINQLQADWKKKVTDWERENEKRKILGLPPLSAPNPCDLLPPGRCPKVVIVGDPTVQRVWTHDAWLESVKGGRTYQYRMRMVLLNPYAGQPKQLKDPQDATAWFVEGPWSEPSDPITIKPETQFFVKSASGSRGVSFDVFKWYRGVWVNGSFTCQRWDEVGGDSRARVPDEANPTPLIDFRTGFTVVDIDFDRQIRPRERAGRDGVQFDAPEETVTVTLMDASGELIERVPEVDKLDPAYAELRKNVYRPPPKPREDLPKPVGPKPRPGPKP
ncbi:MAG: hypothetical protein C4547_03725 [Phycisphaerales bacterium]|nr:MAG: hypothetical protein C4547_03725 [Phycisphaerales bacterium]